MKKILLFAGLLFGSVFSVNAQTTIYSQDFTTATGAGLSVIDADGDANNWGLFTGNATTAAWGLTGNFAGSRSWNPSTGTPAGPLTPNNYLITPEIVIPGTAGLTTTLSFKVGVNDPTAFAEQLSVYVIPPTANTAELIEAITPAFNRTMNVTNAQTAITYTVNISGSAGQTVRIALRHHDCTDQNLLYFDDLKVTQAALSTNEFLASQLKVYPNPSNNFVTISTDANVMFNQVSLTDLNGRTVKIVELNGDSSAQINISDLAAGVYMMNINSDQGSLTKKIIKN